MEFKPDYVLSVWNINDLMYLCLNVIILVTNYFELISLEQQRMIAAVSACTLCFKVLDWLRLFDSTSFFVSLIKETVLGIEPFMYIMFVWYMTFGISFYILNLNRDEESQIMTVESKLWFYEAFESAYELGHGEFALDSYASDNGFETFMCYFLFDTASFFVIIVFLNMLVAIMGDTFSNVTENTEKNSLITKIAIVKDYVKLIDETHVVEPRVVQISDLPFVEEAKKQDADKNAEPPQEKEKKAGEDIEYLYVVQTDSNN